MNAREQKIIKVMLDYLYDRDGAQVAEGILHAEVNLRISPTASLGEFNAALKKADDSGWLTGVIARYGNGKLWRLSQLGEATRLEMQ